MCGGINSEPLLQDNEAPQRGILGFAAVPVDAGLFVLPDSRTNVECQVAGC